VKERTLPEDSEPVSELHRAMRYVLLAGAEQDLTALHSKAREWLAADMKGFMGHLAQLDRAAVRADGKGAARGAEDGAPAEADEGDRRASDHIDRILRECGRDH
jgi:hypothetical protein